MIKCRIKLWLATGYNNKHPTFVKHSQNLLKLIGTTKVSCDTLVMCWTMRKLGRIASSCVKVIALSQCVHLSYHWWQALTEHDSVARKHRVRPRPNCRDLLSNDTLSIVKKYQYLWSIPGNICYPCLGMPSSIYNIQRCATGTITRKYVWLLPNLIVWTGNTNICSHNVWDII